jgi:transposase-like protein
MLFFYCYAQMSLIRKAFKSFRRAQTLLAGIERIHMIRKGHYQHSQSEGLSPAEQGYLLAA